MNNPTGPRSESIVTQALNVGLEVFSVVLSFLSRGALQIHSDLPGGEKVGRAPFSEAIATIFGNRDVDDLHAADGTSPGAADG